MARITLIWTKSKKMAEMRVDDHYIGSLPVERMNTEGFQVMLHGAEGWPLISIGKLGNTVEIVEIDEVRKVTKVDE